MSADLFLDTNVLIDQLDTRDERKHQIAEKLIKQALATEGACISFQLDQECLNTVLQRPRSAWMSSMPGLGWTPCWCRWIVSFPPQLLIGAALLCRSVGNTASTIH